jgi:glycosyltransferase involved in cell wall biosynthesis
MRIMYLTQWFEPEPNIIKGLAFVRALEQAGHEVTVVTGLPNYPTGRLYPGYRLRPIQRESFEGVRVVRLPLYPSHDASSLRRSLNFLSFFASALIYGLLRRERYDLAYVYHPPITVGLAAALAGRVRGLPFVLDVQDLWPDTVAATGMRGARRLTGLLGLLCAFVYREASAVVVQSQGMAAALVARGVPPGKITAIRNWADAELIPAVRGGGLGRFTLVYGGNLGLAQGLETVIDAAALLQARGAQVEIRLYGDGIQAAELRGRAARIGLTNLKIAPRVPQAEMAQVFAAADGLLMHLADDPLFAITIPSKTQAYLAAGRPIVAGVAGEAAELLRASGAAVLAPPGDADALARAIAALAETPRAAREAMGRAGRSFYRANLSFDRGLDRTLKVLDGIHLGVASLEAATP